MFLMIVADHFSILCTSFRNHSYVTRFLRLSLNKWMGACNWLRQTTIIRDLTPGLRTECVSLEIHMKNGL